MLRPALSLIVVAAGLALPTAAQAAPCPKPARLAVHQQSPGAVKVTWRAIEGGPAYRVLRNRAVVGQTTARSMIVRGRPGLTITVKVGVVGPGGRAPSCYSARRVRVATAQRLPAPLQLSLRTLDDRRVRVSWQRVRGALRYRVVRDGKLVVTTKRAAADVPVTAGATVAFSVAAFGPAGRAGKSAKLRFNGTVRGATAPGVLSAPIVTTNGARLAWTAAAPGTFPIRAYRVYRDGQVVGQYAALGADVTGLGPNRQYAFAVAAVDVRGGVGPTRAITVRTSLPAATSGRLHAFVLSSTDDSFRSLQRNFAKVGVVYPTYYDCDPLDVANVRGSNDPLITQWAKDRRILVMPRFNCQRPQALTAIFSDAAKRAALLQRLVALAEQQDFDGINLDFEAGTPAQRDALSAFVADLAGALHRAGRKLTVDVSPKVKDVANHPRSTFFDYPVIAQHADWVWVMSWGLHWSTSVPGPIAPADWLRQVYDYVATVPNKERFIVGLPLYGFDWPAGGGPANPARPLSYADVQQLLSRYGAQPVKDEASGELKFTYTDESGVGHEVWYGDGPTLGARWRIGLDRGLGGIGAWRLGQEDPAFWNEPVVAG